MVHLCRQPEWIYDNLYIQTGVIKPMPNNQPRVPLAGSINLFGIERTIQVNHCRMPDCINYAVPAKTTKEKKATRANRIWHIGCIPPILEPSPPSSAKPVRIIRHKIQCINHFRNPSAGCLYRLWHLSKRSAAGILPVRTMISRLPITLVPTASKVRSQTVHR